MKNKIAITTGDLEGIGEEVTKKALLQLNLPHNQVIIIGKNLGLGYETIEVDDKDNGRFCYKSLEIACNLAHKGEIGAIVTASVSKEVLNKSGYKFGGQTEILEHLLGGKAEMVFIARDLRVLLLVRHTPLKDVKLNKDEVVDKILRFNRFLIEKCRIKLPKLALCALNPHAGEGGILGDEEITILNPAVDILRSQNIDITKPLSADALFGKIGQKYLTNQKQDYDGIIACYHDQALCPVKALAFDEVVNTTIGLKVIRTSPSHGTAYGIKGKNIANPKSTIEAIKQALSYCI